MPATLRLVGPSASRTKGLQRWEGSARKSFSSSSRAEKQRLVIVGSGWGGYNLMRALDRNAYDVTMISPTCYFSFTPLLASTAVGTLEFRCAVEPVRKYGGEVQAYQAWVNSVNLESKTLSCWPATSGVNNISDFPTPQTPLDERKYEYTDASYPGTAPFQVKYDKLVLAVGAYSRTFNTPGVKEHAHFLKDVKDARKIRSRIVECFEQASQPTLTDRERTNLLHFVIVGGGPTGIEFAAELHDLLSSDILRGYPTLAPMAKVTLYDVAPKILQSFDPGLVEHAMAKFARDGIDIRTNRHVTKVNETALEIKEEGVVPFGLLVWSTGLAPNPLIRSITDLKHEPKSLSLEVDSHFRTKWTSGALNENVFAIGDASVLDSGALPATAQVANQQAKHLAKFLNRQMNGRALPEPFVFKNMGILAYVGGWDALFDRSKAATGPKHTESGRLAWLLWRSAYFSQALSMRNKAQLAFYWFLNWIFGRDITRF